MFEWHSSQWSSAKRNGRTNHRAYGLPLLILFLFSCHKEAPSPQTNTVRNVILISIDTLRADALSVYGNKTPSPFFDQFAKQSVVFENAFTSAPITLPAHTSLLTGLIPPHHGARHNGIFKASKQLTLLSEIAKQQGMRTGAFVGGFPLASQFGLNQGFDTYDDAFPATTSVPGTFSYAERNAEEVRLRAEKWLGRNQSSPFFLWMHLFDPHHPYISHDFPSVPPYQQEVLYVDQQLSLFFQFLKQRDLVRSSLIVIVSDHGEAFGEHREVSHSLFVYNTTLRIPLMISFPGTPAARRKDLARIIDIFPTILEIMNWKLSESFDGQSLLPALQGKALSEVENYAETYAPAYDFGWSPLISIQSVREKFIQAPRPELYELNKDPGETNNLAKSRDLSAFRKKITAFQSQTVSGTTHTPTPEEREKLASLGYLAGGPARESSIDPKDRTEIAARIAELAMSPESPVEKVKAYGEIVKVEPENPVVLSRYGEILLGMRRYEEAEKINLKLIDLKYPAASPYNALALIYFFRKQPGRAEEILTRAVNTGFADGETYYNLAEFRLNSGKREEAFRLYDRSMEFGFAEAFYRKARLLAVMGDYKGAFELLDRTEQQLPGRVQTNYDRGLLLFRQNRYAEALEQFELARKKAPEETGLLYNIGVAYYRMNEKEKAQITLKRFLEEAPAPEWKEQRQTALQILKDLSNKK